MCVIICILYVYMYSLFGVCTCVCIDIINFTRMYIFSYIARAIMCSVNLVKLSKSFVLKNGQCYFILYHIFQSYQRTNWW